MTGPLVSSMAAVEAAAHTTNIEPTESRQTFVDEIRSDRLDTLWKSTLAFAIVLAWILLIISASRSDINAFDFTLPVLFTVAASIATRQLLRVERYHAATLAYSIGLIAATASLTFPESEDLRTAAPMLAILVIFIIGMLLSVRETIFLVALIYIGMIVPVWLLTGDLPITSTGVFGFVLMGVTTLLVTQVSGELYGIAEWALDSYRKERETATKLHDSRQEVEKSLLKQKNLTTQLQSINEELDEARRSAELAKQFRGQFLANMSHELRTPLNAIIGFSETMLNFPMMYENVALPKEYQRDMERIYSSGRHLLGIINDILDLSKIDVGRLEIEIQPVELEPIIKGLMSTGVGLIGVKPVELRRDTPDELPIVLGDPLRVRQVLLNLLSNAAKFTEKGSVTIKVTAEPEHVLVAVQDTGPGIAPDHLEAIFEAFQQGESGRKLKREGSGLGLAISKELLTLMNGTIRVESEVGKGATFFVTFPRHAYNPNAEWQTAEEHTS